MPTLQGIFMNIIVIAVGFTKFLGQITGSLDAKAKTKRVKFQISGFVKLMQTLC